MAGLLLLLCLLQDDVDLLIERLGHDDPDIRAEAHARLIKIGRSIEPKLRKALASGDVEVRLRAAEILDALPAELREVARFNSTERFAFSPDGKILAFYETGGRLRAVSTDQWKDLHSAKFGDLPQSACKGCKMPGKEHPWARAPITFSQDGKRLLAEVNPGRLSSMDAHSGENQRDLLPVMGVVLSLHEVPGGARVTGGESGATVRTARGVDCKLAMSPSDPSIVLGDRSGRILCGLVSGKRSTLYEFDPDTFKVSARQDLSVPAHWICGSADLGMLYVAADGGNVVRGCALGPLRETGQLFQQEARLTMIATDFEGRWLLTGGIDGKLRIYHTLSGQLMTHLALDAPPRFAAFSPDRAFLAVQSGPKLIIFRVER